MRGTMGGLSTLALLSGLLHLIECISYSNLNLTEVPNDLANSRTILIENNLISTVGDGLFGNKLVTLKLNKNRLTEISPNAFCGTQLGVLQMEDNLLTSIPDLTCVKSTLRQILLSANRLSGHIGGGVFSDCPNMVKIRLMHNFINSIGPDAFCRTSLKIFTVQNNSLTEMPDLSCVGNTLEIFYLFDNKISSTKESDFTSFRALKELGLSGNYVTTLDHITEATNLWPTLELLKVAVLALTEVNFTAGSFPVLETLEIHINQLRCFRMVGAPFLKLRLMSLLGGDSNF